jgi:hypothetical protein
MRRISTFLMPTFLVLSIVAAVTSAHACRMVPEPGGGYKYVCEPPPPPPMIRYYGAIAYSPSTGAFGYSDRYANRASAQTRALSECGKADCVVASWFYNNCGAVAMNGNGSWGGGHGPTVSSAGSDAEHACVREGGGACVVKLTHCSGG